MGWEGAVENRGVDLPIALLESDLGHAAMIEPAEVFDHPPAPSAAVLCYFQDVIAETAQTSRVHTQLTSVYGGRRVYVREHNGQEVAVFYPGLGAPAAATALEEGIAMGCRSFIAVGGAGGLVPQMSLGAALVVEDAIRDEGTSFHYLPPGRLAQANPDAITALEVSLGAANLPFTRGRTWTTDAIYRETRSRVARRVLEGAVTVEMEASALFAVADYRGVALGQLLYAGDTLAEDTWADREWTTAADIRRGLFEVALTAAVALDRQRGAAS